MKRHFEDLQLGSIELFCLAAEASSFTAAAQVAGVTPAAVSRSISRLEERLGSRLFVRTTRSIRLTDGGRTFFEQCRQALTQLVEAQQEMMGAQSVPSGLLRISIPTTYGHHRILPLLPKFRALYPQVSVDIHISNRNIDFVAEGYDLAIRVRAQPDSTLIARLLEDARLVVVATPSYLKRAGTPQALEDLPNHECIQYELPSNGRRISWLFQVDGKEREFAGEAGYSCSDDVLGGVTLAKHGAGLFQTYKFIVEEELANGSLVEVLQPYGGRSRPFTLLYPHGRYVPHRVRAFVDFLLEHRAEWAAL
ncbi:LysR family transcriptional regulator [Pseudomonas sp. D8002]|jgi:DNA-binding transcriptional LysR family regulator|uniref:LysR family transcriptional regulator n=1 Tax=unclassified Pseudomonas TaxID=196821 RepID=UPI000272C4FB|nr:MULTISPECIES: LysR family transcriptional regulator [unclassified Pseudomonas]EJF72171.1 LysR family transcriptional regulator [Pseudomonas sp. Ag1]MBT1266576.1 LysR family transcriptional regulator [Pseudomonas sp. VS38]MDQ0666967.1 DNA-binding transcriptional LysR family regulator [Pseudomonas sp. W2I6]NWA91286.1 LysR family transcriptional regulator [Pseudomonas sp. D8002]NWB07319.1 LysR family transcriptional regulator [Pseudomonas sp. D5002]